MVKVLEGPNTVDHAGFPMKEILKTRATQGMLMMLPYLTEVVLLQVCGVAEVVGAGKMLCQLTNTLSMTILWDLVTMRAITTTKVAMDRSSPQCTKYQEEGLEATLNNKAEVIQEAATSVPIRDLREGMKIITLGEASSMRPIATTCQMVITRWSNITMTSTTIKLQIVAMKTQQTNTTETSSRVEVVQIQGSKTHKDKREKFKTEKLQEEATFEETTLINQWLLTTEEPI